jgi:hypothetical protein
LTEKQKKKREARLADIRSGINKEAKGEVVSPGQKIKGKIKQGYN